MSINFLKTQGFNLFVTREYYLSGKNMFKTRETKFIYIKFIKIYCHLSPLKFFTKVSVLTFSS